MSKYLELTRDLKHISHFLCSTYQMRRYFDSAAIEIHNKLMYFEKGISSDSQNVWYLFAHNKQEGSSFSLFSSKKRRHFVHSSFSSSAGPLSRLIKKFHYILSFLSTRGEILYLICLLLLTIYNFPG